MTDAMKDLIRAEQHGIELKESAVGTFATSATHRGVIYRVNEDHCDCLGFHYRGHCKHSALFVARQVLRGLNYFGAGI